MENEILNRVEKSGLIQLNIEDLYPKGERVKIDITDFLENGLILREKPFRELVNQTNWDVYKDKYVAVFLKEDAIVPLWAYMLIASKLAPISKKVVVGDFSVLETAIFTDVFNAFDFSAYADKNLILKGCGKLPIPNNVFIEFTLKLQEQAKSIMFGEACSAVPVYKQKKS